MGNYPHALGRLQVGNLISIFAPSIVNQEEEAASNALQANYFSGRNVENSLTIALSTTDNKVFLHLVQWSAGALSSFPIIAHKRQSSCSSAK